METLGCYASYGTPGSVVSTYGTTYSMWESPSASYASTVVTSLLLVLAELVVILAMAIVLSSYERRAMSLLHNRDAPVVYLLLGMGQPIADGGKLILKSMSSGVPRVLAP